ncbi:hypothetical protein [Mycolicibacterium phlei]|uniref:hypothetical protein n=1 Tax=Mycolicibacterium phlei TaxID=1771 RepID=UPI000315B919|nr:hypothetical protein [Mycolicibacterium phlei]
MRLIVEYEVPPAREDTVKRLHDEGDRAGLLEVAEECPVESVTVLGIPQPRRRK